MKIASFLGKKGEDTATEYLQKKGFTIIERNFSIRYGEIDIIARKKNIVVFVEVKARISHAYGSPLEAITPWKLKSLIKTAEYYSISHPHLPVQKRIDAIGILFNSAYQVVTLEHHENITV